MQIRKFSVIKSSKDNEVLTLVKESSYYSTTECFITPQSIVEFFCNTIKLNVCAEEYAYLIGFDTKNHILGLFEVSHGSVNASVVGMREIFIRALLCGAVNIILVHNHPSGIPSPSAEDISITKKISDAGKMICVNLMDHIIVGDNGSYYSFKEHAMM